MLERHFVSKHELYNTKYPLDSTTRKIKYDSLKSCLEKQKNLFQQMSSSVDCETRASNMVSWILAKNLKPFTDGEIIKECMIEASKFLFPNDKKIHDKFQSMHMSARTVTRKIEKMVVNVYEQLSNNLKVPLQKISSVVTDGAPAMIGRIRKVVSLLRNSGEFPNKFMSYHCVIHQETQCAKVATIDDVMTAVVKTINHIRSNALKRRQFRALMEQNEDEHGDLLLD
ncbi:uncharacterized protein LOC136091124 [Hydra vulgaris]|uniref:Uncharacterized protein LOC136091124 n=1 Tax=Hydra vulgaris TaxID=6087 RepID=A0ABM4DI50_HYDVU